VTVARRPVENLEALHLVRVDVLAGHSALPLQFEVELEVRAASIGPGRGNGVGPADEIRVLLRGDLEDHLVLRGILDQDAVAVRIRNGTGNPGAHALELGLIRKDDSEAAQCR
jgi:hypothetical protein